MQKAYSSKKKWPKKQSTSLEKAGGPDGKMRKENPQQSNKSRAAQKEKTTQSRKGWKGYVQMSRGDFERNLALKRAEKQQSPSGKTGTQTQDGQHVYSIIIKKADVLKKYI